MKAVCGHCNKEFDGAVVGDHECEPSCIHCGVTYKELEEPEYESPKIAVSRHERKCSERPGAWDKPIRDPEGEFRAERREREHQRQWEEKLRRERHIW